MKVYCFYLLGVNIDNVYDYKGVVADSINTLNDRDTTYTLYAYTTNKELRDKFILMHDMSKFIYKKLKVTKDNLERLYAENPEYVLDNRKIFTRKIKHGMYLPGYVKIICTDIEYESVTTFKEENFFELLDDFFNLIEYDEMINNIILRFINDDLMRDLNEVLLLDALLPKMFPYEEGMPCDIMIDELGLYTRLFANILKQ